MDIFNNIVFEYNISQKTVVSLQNIYNEFGTKFEILNNICLECDTGILLNEISVKNSINTTYIFDVAIYNNTFLPKHSILALNIIGCPIGYAPEQNNNYTCIVCNTDF
eukprot:245561_1